ncbi:MAG: adenylyltransferase/cytidyltransferase family protein [Anaerolineae bacterium]|nr:adenylyltransferase/cytidyltransferase family protein [Anaerolineae bacterium]
MNKVVVTGAFDDIRSRDLRFLEEAARLGTLHVLLWSDAVAQALTGRAPKFPEAERQYFLQAVRYVDRLTLVTEPPAPDALPQVAGLTPDVWATRAAEDTPQRRAYCAADGLTYRVLTDADLAGFANFSVESPPDRKKVLVTGCYDWLHSGHVRFFEEVSALGDLYVVVGNDANVEMLKGAGHPLLGQDERRYVVQSIRYVKQTLISTGSGWMDAEPEIARIRPDIYAVNEDGDKPEKRTFCQEHGLEYVVLKRLPKEGLTRRTSTDLRGF